MCKPVSGSAAVHLPPAVGSWLVLRPDPPSGLLTEQAEYMVSALNYFHVVASQYYPVHRWVMCSALRDLPQFVHVDIIHCMWRTHVLVDLLYFAVF